VKVTSLVYPKPLFKNREELHLATRRDRPARPRLFVQADALAESSRTCKVIPRYLPGLPSRSLSLAKRSIAQCLPYISWPPSHPIPFDPITPLWLTLAMAGQQNSRSPSWLCEVAREWRTKRPAGYRKMRPSAFRHPMPPGFRHA
jgi:hypothetical protein